MITVNVDRLMDVSGFGGIMIYLGAHWWRLQSFGVPRPWLNTALRTVGLIMILIPLFMRWYLSASLILALSVLMAVWSAAMHFHWKGNGPR